MKSIVSCFHNEGNKVNSVSLALKYFISGSITKNSSVSNS